MQNPETGMLEPISEELFQQLRGTDACVFQRNQEVEFLNGRFRIAAYGRKFIKLEALPGTRVREGHGDSD